MNMEPKSYANALSRNYLKLCDVCNGTGVNPNDKSLKCPKCDELRILNRLEVCFTMDVPYTNEADRKGNISMILDEVRTIFENLHLD